MNKLEDLAHKEKSVSDLVRYIKNTAQSGSSSFTPNYSILLGAGASVTSGISSGQDLIKEWKAEVWKEQKDCHEYDSAEDYFEQRAPSWYEPSNAYSSLFENRYDLQRHRRIFVERQVSGKTPSIGYAYLVKLIENGFFNTIFTTNFDDLLNEAFYRFSMHRPIVCAHDSSISGVTVTSPRPKIIKLHGDYLFENIKATLRETDSLENNMRLKFQEFAKDFGLIVVGYSGQDRSIMDILKYLLSHEEYFKNGVFWCIRKSDKDKVSSELKKLLWLDRVYLVYIDGFDELFAEINSKLNEGVLPVDDDFLSRNHQKNIIQELTENPYIASSPSDILLSDCAKLKTHLESSLTTDFIDFLKEKRSQNTPEKQRHFRSKHKPNLPEMTNEELRSIQNLETEAFMMGHKNSVLQKIDNLNIFDLPNSGYKLALLELRVHLQDDLSDDEIRKYFDELILLDPRNQMYYEVAANKSDSYFQSINYLDRAVKEFSNDYYIYNQLAKCKLSYCQEYPMSSDCVDMCDTAISNCRKSIELNSGVGNEAYVILINLLEIKYDNTKDKFEKEVKLIYDKLSAVNKYHPNTLYAQKKHCKERYNAETIKDAIDFYADADNETRLEELYVEYMRWSLENSAKEKDDTLDIIRDYEQHYEPSDHFMINKARWLIENEYFTNALELLQTLPKSPSRDEKLLQVYSYLNEIDKFEECYANSEYKKQIVEDYYELKGAYTELVSYYELHQQDNGFMSKERVMSYGYALLKIAEYRKAEKILKPYYDSPQCCEGSIIVNYLYARKMQGNNVEKQIKSKLLEHQFIKYSDEEMLGGYCVLGDEKNAYQLLKKIVKKCRREKYSIEGWPVLAKFRNLPRFQELLKHNPQVLPVESKE